MRHPGDLEILRGGLTSRVLVPSTRAVTVNKSAKPSAIPSLPIGLSTSSRAGPLVSAIAEASAVGGGESFPGIAKKRQIKMNCRGMHRSSRRDESLGPIVNGSAQAVNRKD